MPKPVGRAAARLAGTLALHGRFGMPPNDETTQLLFCGDAPGRVLEPPAHSSARSGDAPATIGSRGLVNGVQHLGVGTAPFGIAADVTELFSQMLHALSAGFSKLQHGRLICGKGPEHALE